MKRLGFLFVSLMTFAQADVLVNGKSPEVAFAPFISKNYMVSASREIENPTMKLFSPFLNPATIIKDTNKKTMIEVTVLLVDNNSAFILLKKHSNVVFSTMNGGLGESAVSDSRDVEKEVLESKWALKNTRIEIENYGTLEYLDYNAKPALLFNVTSPSQSESKIARELPARILLVPTKMNKLSQY